MLSSLSSFTSVTQETVNISYLEVLGGETTLQCRDTPPNSSGIYHARRCTDDSNNYLCAWVENLALGTKGTCTISVE